MQESRGGVDSGLCLRQGRASTKFSCHNSESSGLPNLATTIAQLGCGNCPSWSRQLSKLVAMNAQRGCGNYPTWSRPILHCLVTSAGESPESLMILGSFLSSIDGPGAFRHNGPH